MAMLETTEDERTFWAVWPAADEMRSLLETKGSELNAFGLQRATRPTIDEVDAVFVRHALSGWGTDKLYITARRRNDAWIVSHVLHLAGT